jgi:hypothetical protein
MLEPDSTIVSLVRLAVPLAVSTPPTPSELRQPAWMPAGLLLPHGHGPAGLIPGQNGAPVTVATVIASVDVASSRMLVALGSLVHTTFSPIHVAPPAISDWTRLVTSKL